jgi:hypothetical protein
MLKCFKFFRSTSINIIIFIFLVNKALKISTRKKKETKIKIDNRITNQVNLLEHKIELFCKNFARDNLDNGISSNNNENSEL